MIEANDILFPNCISDIIATRMETLEGPPEIVVPGGRVGVFRRSLRPTDPNQAIGIFPVMTRPDENSYEMKGGRPGIHEPTVVRHEIGIQCLVKDADEFRGTATHTTLTKLVATVLYRDPPLRVALAGLSATLNFGSFQVTERALRWGIRSTNYLSNEMSGRFVFLSTLEVYFDTETA